MEQWFPYVSAFRALNHSAQQHLEQHHTYAAYMMRSATQVAIFVSEQPSHCISLINH